MVKDTQLSARGTKTHRWIRILAPITLSKRGHKHSREVAHQPKSLSAARTRGALSIRAITPQGIPIGKSVPECQRGFGRRPNEVQFEFPDST